jgi:hypothetical protein
VICNESLLVCRTDQWDAAGADGAAALEQAAAGLLRAGANVRDGDLPFSCAAPMGSGMPILATDARAAFGHELRMAPDLISAKMHDFLAKAEPGNRSLYDAAKLAVEEARGQFHAMFGEIDAGPLPPPAKRRPGLARPAMARSISCGRCCTDPRWQCPAFPARPGCRSACN